MKYFLASDVSFILGALGDPSTRAYSSEEGLMDNVEDGQYVYEIHVGQRRLAKVSRAVEIVNG